MKRLLTFVITTLLTFSLYAQILQPVKWQAQVVGDSTRMVATIDPGWHMTLISVNDSTIGQEYQDTCVLLLANANAINGQQVVRFNACDDMNCTQPETWSYTIVQQPAIEVQEPSSHPRSVWTIFLLGLLGGFMAIFTPCVWPIIPMTVSFFLKRTDKGSKAAIIYGMAIILIYVGLGLLVTILFGASALNAIATNAIVNIFFFLLLVVFALSFFGLFEITLPSSWATKLDSKARATGGILGILLMAFTLAIVSFSCTGPIIGTLLVEAAGKSLLAPTMGMLGFAIALALPFSLFAMFPQWMKSMPKSGGWMDSLKVVLAFLELALSLKFLSVADLAYGWGILPRKLFIALWILCFLGIAIYLLWNIRKVTRTRQVIRILVIVPSIFFAAYLVPGILSNAPVRAIAAFAPPMPIENQQVFHDYEQGLAYAKQENKPILLNFSGYGCVNCRKMEQYVLTDTIVKQRIENYVFIELFVDDKRPHASGEQSIGDYNSKIQRENFKANAQPYYIQLSSKGEVISLPYAFSTDVQQFLQWLKY